MWTSNGRHWHQWLACNDAATLTNDGDEALALAQAMAMAMMTALTTRMTMTVDNDGDDNNGVMGMVMATMVVCWHHRR